MKLINADCIEAMKAMPDNSVDSIVTDPPYELGFMGKSWDASGIAFNVEVWREALRVIKPGGHLIAFSGSRTYHRMAVAIEDAGFEIRDQIMWVYGSGFPKSHNVSKGIDKRGGATANFEEFRNAVKSAMKNQGLKTSALTDALGNFMLSHYLTAGSQPAIPNYRDFKIIRDFVNLGSSFDHLFADEAEREIIGMGAAQCGQLEKTGVCDGHFDNGTLTVKHQLATASSTPAAKQWDGWGTALKPAHEPMVLARKPLIGTVANNVLTHGTGGLNIDGSRVGSEGGGTNCTNRDENGNCVGHENAGRSTSGATIHAAESTGGRWPANFIHDGSDEVVGLFPDTKAGIAKRGNSGGNNFGSDTPKPPLDDIGYADSGSAARFFYCAKASKRDRNEGLDGFEAKRDHDGRADGGVGGDNPRNRTNNAKLNHHPTVKPTTLMQYLVRLVTPPNGTVLDPFMGSGSTGKACAYEGFNFIGIDQSAEYVAIAQARIDFATSDKLPL